MKLKTFVASNLQEALKQVKKELGEDAVILSTQKKALEDNGTGKRRRLGVEVVAAVDPEPSVTVAAGRPVRLGSSPLPAATGPGASVYGELQAMQDLLLQMVRNTAPPQWLQAHQELTAFYRFLLRTGVDEVFLADWLKAIQVRLTSTGDPNGGWREVAVAPLMDACEIINPWCDQPHSLQVWTLVGPTGVGKTTTLAKLAAHYSLVQRKKVGLLSLDTYRLGAQGQIEAFARIMGLPLAQAGNRPELVAALKSLQDQDLVLIDTTGRSPLYPGLQQEYEGLLGGLPGLKHHLVLSATAKKADLDIVFTTFGFLGVSSCIITKLDETRDFSGVFNVLQRHRQPVSFLSAGQRVPEDLELASKRRLAELLLNSGPVARG